MNANMSEHRLYRRSSVTDLTQFYHTDTRTITRYEYDAQSGALSNPRFFVVLDSGEMPDGMTVDAAGGVWCALFDGWHIVHFDPNNNEVERIAFTAKHVASLTFGGAQYTDLYVSTSGGEDKANNGLVLQPHFH